MRLDPVAIAGLLLTALLGPVWGGENRSLPVVRLSGSPAEIGTQHGKALRQQIATLHEQYLMSFLRDPATYKRALGGAFLFRGRMLPEHKQEMLALAQAAGIDPGDAMIAQCFLDLVSMTQCSTITLPADAAPDRVARFGRNLDFPGLDVADKHSVLLIVRPQRRYAFAAVGWPGLIGVLSGMNEHGLTLANMEVRRPQRMPEAMPYTLLYRMILERCRTVDEAIDMLEKTPRQTANNLMLMDAGGARAIVEIQPEKIFVRRGVPGQALVSTNDQRGPDADKQGICWRYDLLRRRSAEQYGAIDAGTIQKMLGAANQGKMTLQSMVFEPSRLVLYVATGSQATSRPYERFELKELLGAKGDGASRTNAVR